VCSERVCEALFGSYASSARSPLSPSAG
jgi:hypothetical protein